MIWHVQSPAGLRQLRAGVSLERKMRVPLGITAAHMTAGIGMSGSTQEIEGGMAVASMTGTGSTDMRHMIGAAAIETAASLMRGPRTDTVTIGYSVFSGESMNLHSPCCIDLYRLRAVGPRAARSGSETNSRCIRMYWDH